VSGQRHLPAGARRRPQRGQPLYNRIAADPRHGAGRTAGYEEITERRFAGWAMGQVDMSRLNPALLLKYSERRCSTPTRCRVRRRWRCCRN
jgi:hypothetical protein